MTEKKSNSISSVVLFVIGAIVSALIGYYVARYLGESNVSIQYYQAANLYAAIGLNRIDSDLNLEVNRVIYKNTEYQSLRLVRFYILNDSGRNLRNDAQFVFISSDNRLIPPQAVVDVFCECQAAISSGSLVVIDRQDIQNLGPGFKLVSDLPGLSQIGVVIVLDTSGDPSLRDISIGVQKLAREQENFQLLTPSDTITLSTLSYALSLVAAAIAYITIITFINLRIGVYGFGSRLIDRISMKLIGREIMRSFLKENKSSPR
jgi:hypothetical protein